MKWSRETWRGLFFGLWLPMALVLVLTFLFVLWVNDARAEDNTLSWTPPTGTEECSDTGPLQPGDLLGYRIYLRVADIADPSVTSYVFEDMPPGEYTYVSTAYTANAESRLSGAATKTVTSFFAPAGSQVYQPVTISSGFWMIPMGTLSADTDCDVTTEVTSAGTKYHRVPQDNLVWSPGSTARPVMVVAECG